MNMEMNKPDRQPGKDDMPEATTAGHAPEPSDSSELPGLDTYVTYEEMEKMGPGIAQLLHKLIDVCVSLTTGRKRNEN